MSQEDLCKKRAEVFRRLEEAEKQFFFGDLYAGSHEYTEEGYQAARQNDALKRELRAELRSIDERLGLKLDSGESI